MEISEKILYIVKTKGPILPVELSKEINTNILMASAYLSEQVSNKKIKITHIKVGGSPLYYVNGQEHKLQNFYNNLHEKERKIYDLLKRNKVLRDITQQPIVRVVLRQIKDFAKPLEVNVKGNKELFWRWYLLSNQETESLIRQIMQRHEKQPKIEKKQETGEKQSFSDVQNQKISKEPLISIKPEKSLFVDKTTTDDFLSKIKLYFKEKDIEVIDHNIIRKNSDMEFTVKVPTNVGKQTYYCKAKNKKKCNDGDLSSAYVKGEFKKYPILFITTGDFTKKAKEMLLNEFKNIKIQKI